MCYRDSLEDNPARLSVAPVRADPTAVVLCFVTAGVLVLALVLALLRVLPLEARP